MNTLNVGDKIRILEDGLECAWVVKGDVLEVLEIEESTGSFRTEAPNLVRSKSMWIFGLENEGTGWEKYEGEK